jgi:Heterokaryon incompatibility protein (HET)
MRLIHSKTLRLKEFSEDEIPPYAILSHTWGEGEVSLQDMEDCDVDKKIGYDKIKRCCIQAAADGFEYTWVDTCCIDKTSSSELSEAINSMYRWYQEADVCYTYLSDVPTGRDPHVSGSDFSKSRWFTRGWTLQELVAPTTVIFFSSDWKEIGTKSSLQEVVANATGIPATAFLGYDDDLRTFSVAQRMSWAAKRETTRTEDLAYCLLGLFDVSMPLLYGEGQRAFIRLQEDIMRRSDDPTIFAWTSDIIWDTRCVLLAPTPSRFLRSGNIIRSHDRKSASFTLTNKGVHIELPVFHLDNQPGAFLGVLDCHYTDDNEHVLGIWLEKDETGEGAYRISGDVLGMMTNLAANDLERETIYIKQLPLMDFRKYIRHYKHYLVRAANIQDCYPPRFVQQDGTIDLQAWPHKDSIGAIKVVVNGNSRVVVLKIAADALSANIVTPLPGESVEEIVRSLDTNASAIEKRVWINEPDRIVQQIPLGGRLSVEIRKQIVFGRRTLIAGISM